MVKTIEWAGDAVVMIDQTRLPAEETYVRCGSYKEVAEAIRSMVIRGAPAIGVAAAMGVALGVKQAAPERLDEEFEVICSTLAAAYCRAGPSAARPAAPDPRSRCRREPGTGHRPSRQARWRGGRP